MATGAPLRSSRVMLVSTRGAPRARVGQTENYVDHLFRAALDDGCMVERMLDV
jgi:hypothetical protein